MEPNALFDYMNDKKVSSVGWSVSAFTILTSLGAFEEVGLKSLRKICFSGSVMPCRVLRKWQENLPEAHFVNQYGRQRPQHHAHTIAWIIQWKRTRCFL